MTQKIKNHRRVILESLLDSYIESLFTNIS